jgi:hypothetical protein
MMHSFFVFTRVLADGREVIAVGCGVLPHGCRQVGCHKSLNAALAQRDRLRREGLRVTWTPTMRQRAPKRQEVA